MSDSDLKKIEYFEHKFLEKLYNYFKINEKIFFGVYIYFLCYVMIYLILIAF